MSDQSLPPIVHGVLISKGFDTAAGIVSRSSTQTGWTVQKARRMAGGTLADLTDDDVLWLLLMGWAP